MKADPMWEMLSPKPPELTVRSLLSDDDACAVMEKKPQRRNDLHRCRAVGLVAPDECVRHAIAERANKPAALADAVEMCGPLAERLIWRRIGAHGQRVRSGLRS